MKLNELRDNEGATKSRKRVGRGIGSGSGKTGGRGVKGQKARSGVAINGFEGGQMPLKQRLPKFGFKSRKALTTAEVRLSELAKVEGEVVDMLTLKKARIINESILSAKIILSGEIDRAVTVSGGIRVTKGAQKAIEAAGGKVEA